MTNSLKVNYAVDFHKPLMKVQHLIPKNILLTVDDKIPGIREEVFNGPGRGKKFERFQSFFICFIPH